ncbi:46c4c83f-75db-4900-8385-97dd65142c55 [Thermothielavioides terrestris]|uniref:46c4c83f-75db-4900-8385-97dd65142c55 n=1 Tax=Thermothielavioides terrestris TaxID=2587410 RepID=A0A3S4BAX1_9PEZI|nr:46c4c83f-75db-4900-8385-97dd65142c55 [Thermothielavioides terrestris]
MGNASTKESRSGDASHRAHHSGAPVAHETGGGASLQPERASGRRHRASRGDLGGILGLGSGGGSGSQPEPPYERRETKQEREARRLERERLARIAERERSMKEEHVDGGYLVTMGIYTSPEDFNKQIVRQLQIERKLAPFWRGLNDFSDQWTEPQIIAAARGSREETAPDLDSLTVPIGDRSPSATSEPGTSNPASALSSPVSSQHPRASSPFRPRGKAIASVFGASSRNGSTTEIAPREVQLPHDPFVNGQPLEVFLYKDATECPICFMSYPPYLNHTRCCDQPICSECFVQIKRPDPHFPEGHNENDPNHNPEEAAGLLVSEPACCPYCTQPDFGVVYEPPPFRRGLAYAISPTALGTASTAMSSSSSVNSVNASGGLGSPSSGTGRRRNQSLSASSPSVVLTDRIRPEWATKLQAARAHQARRAAAATALHAAAFLMGNSDNRAFRSRFGRRNTGGSGSAAANNGDGENGDSGSGTPSQSGPDQSRRGGSGGGRGSGRTNIDDLEEMMFAEAIRLSLADEEERKRKAEKEERKAAKKREKEARKAAKAAAKQAGPYEGASSRSGQTSASGSSLSLPGLSFGRKRGNSAASNLRVEASVASALAAGDSPAPDSNYKDKGKGVDRAVSLQTDGGSGLSLGSRSGASEDGGDQDRDRDPSASTEPMFNFRSLAEVVGVSLEGKDAGGAPSQTKAEGAAQDSAHPESLEDERARIDETGNAGLAPENRTTEGLRENKQAEQHDTAPATSSPIPEVTITPDTPATVSVDDDSKQIDGEAAVERVDLATQ